MRAFLWCNGSIPPSSVIDLVSSSGVPVFGVDGGADRALESGIEVDAVSYTHLTLPTTPYV